MQGFFVVDDADFRTDGEGWVEEVLREYASYRITCATQK